MEQERLETSTKTAAVSSAIQAQRGPILQLRKNVNASLPSENISLAARRAKLVAARQCVADLLQIAQKEQSSILESVYNESLANTIKYSAPVSGAEPTPLDGRVLIGTPAQPGAEVEKPASIISSSAASQELNKAQPVVSIGTKEIASPKSKPESTVSSPPVLTLKTGIPNVPNGQISGASVAPVPSASANVSVSPDAGSSGAMSRIAQLLPRRQTPSAVTSTNGNPIGAPVGDSAPDSSAPLLTSPPTPPPPPENHSSSSLSSAPLQPPLPMTQEHTSSPTLPPPSSSAGPTVTGLAASTSSDSSSWRLGGLSILHRKHNHSHPTAPPTLQSGAIAPAAVNSSIASSQPAEGVRAQGAISPQRDSIVSTTGTAHTPPTVTAGSTGPSLTAPGSSKPPESLLETVPPITSVALSADNSEDVNNMAKREDKKNAGAEKGVMSLLIRRTSISSSNSNPNPSTALAPPAGVVTSGPTSPSAHSQHSVSSATSTGPSLTVIAPAGASSTSPSPPPPVTATGQTASNGARDPTISQVVGPASPVQPSSTTAANHLQSPASTEADNKEERGKKVASGKGGAISSMIGSHGELTTDLMDEQTRAAPMTGLAVVYRGDTAGPGYFKIYRSPSGMRADLNKGGGGQFVYLAMSKESSSNTLPITEVTIIYPDRGETAPPGFKTLKRRGLAVDLNTGTLGERIYLCFKRSRNSPITDIKVLFPKKGECLPDGYILVDKTHTGQRADLNYGTSGTEVMICYKKELSTIDCIRVPKVTPHTELIHRRSLRRTRSHPDCVSLGEVVAAASVPEDISTATSAFGSTAAPEGSTRENDVPQEPPVCPSPRPYSKRRSTLRKSLSSEESFNLSFVTAELGTEESPSLAIEVNDSRRENLIQGDGAQPANFVPDQPSPVVHEGEIVGSHSDSESEAGNNDEKQSQSGRSQDPITLLDDGLPSDNMLEGDLPPDNLHSGSGFDPTVSTSQTENEKVSASMECPDAQSGAQPPSEATQSAQHSTSESSQTFMLLSSEPASGTGTGAGAGVDECGTIPASASVPAPRKSETEIPVFMSREEDRILLYPIVATLYVRHGDYSEKALEALSSLIKLGFFDADTEEEGVDQGRGLLDIVVDAVCESIDHTVYAKLPAVVDFLLQVTLRSRHGLHPKTLHRMFEAALYIQACSEHAGRRLAVDICKYIIKKLEAKASASMLAAQAIPSSGDKRNSVFSVSSAASYSSTSSTAATPAASQTNIESSVSLSEPERKEGKNASLVQPAALSWSEIAIRTEKAVSLYRQHGSVTSSGFLADVYESSLTLFASSVLERNYFQLLLSLCKTATSSGKARDGARSGSGSSTGNANTGGGGSGKSSPPLSPDVLRKVFVLDVLRELLTHAGDSVKQSPVFGHQVRRFVAVTLLVNLTTVHEPVIRKILAVISVLWKHYRKYLKIELSQLCENGILRVLRSPHAPVSFQMDVLCELVPLFQLPQNLVEMFVNFDMDKQLVQSWTIIEQLCAIMCAIAEGGAISQSADENQVSELQMQALENVVSISRCLMDASGHAHLIPLDARTRELSMAKHGGWESDDYNVPQGGPPSARSEGSGPPTEPTSPTTSTVDTTGASTNPTSLTDGSQQSGVSAGAEVGSIADANVVVKDKDSTKGTTSTAPRHGEHIDGIDKHRQSSVKLRHQEQQRNQEHLRQAMSLCHSKSLKKCIEYLVATSFLNENPRDIAGFLRMYHDEIGEQEIGEYLGEGDEEMKVHIRLMYVRAISFTGMPLEAALRHYLTNGGFRLPGEGQKIFRMVEAFAQCYWEDNPSRFSTVDTVLKLAYSIIMLNTDLNKPEIKKKRKMNKEDFVRNNRGIDEGKDIPKDLLEAIYVSVQNNPIRMDVLGMPQPASSKSESAEPAESDDEKFRKEMVKAVSQAEELAKGLSHTSRTFYFVGVDTGMSTDIVRNMFERVWFHFLALINSMLNNLDAQHQMISLCLDMLRSSLSACLFLGMKTERQAFATQLGEPIVYMSNASNFKNNTHNCLAAKFRYMTVHSQGSKRPRFDDEDGYLYVVNGKHRDEEWFKNLENANSVDDAWRIIGDVHQLVNELREAIDRMQTVENLKSVAKRINKGAKLLEDCKSFIREGDLVKKCRTKNRLYRFFLFNDQILYCDKGINGRWNTHEVLRLRLTHLENVENSTFQRNAFRICNPKKTFVVIAESAEVKAAWVRDINVAIQQTHMAVKHQVRRFSMLPHAGENGSANGSGRLVEIPDNISEGEEEPEEGEETVEEQVNKPVAAAQQPAKEAEKEAVRRDPALSMPPHELSETSQKDSSPSPVKFSSLFKSTDEQSTTLMPPSDSTQDSNKNTPEVPSG